MANPTALVEEADPALGGVRQRVGRYTLHAEIASGGMATVYYGQMVGAHGFSRVVAIKRMLPRLGRDPTFRSMFVDEARLASRVQHPNVVPILDVVDDQGEVMIVMEYVRGPSLSVLLRSASAAEVRVPVPIAVNIACGMLAGLHAAHEAKDRRGASLGLVHRDVSPQNVLVGFDGVTRIMDFGVAKASNRLNVTKERELKGKLSYMAPEQFGGANIDRRADVFAAGVVLWGMLAGRRLFRGGDVTETMSEVLRCEVPALSTFRDDVPPALEAALRTALSVDRDARPPTAEHFAATLEAATPLASGRAIAEWAQGLGGDKLAERDALIAEIEKTSTNVPLPLDTKPSLEPVATGETPAEVTDSRAVTSDWVSKSERTAATAVEGAVERSRSTSETRPEPPAPPAPTRSRRLLAGGVVAGLVIAIGAVATWRYASAERAVDRAAGAAPAGSAAVSSSATQATAKTVDVTPEVLVAPSAVPSNVPTAETSAQPTKARSTPAAALAPRRAPPPPKPAKTPEGPPRGPYYPPKAFPQ